MDTETAGDRSRLVRVLLAVGLGILALRSLRGGKRLRGILTGVGAVALGVSAAGDSGPAVEPLHETDKTDFDTDADTETDLDTDSSDVSVVADDSADDHAEPAPGSLTCVACGEPIVAGQRRRPNADGETVHDDCL
ncbi:DUF2892 domain-containing protein [Haloarcula pelagica]|uniref:DUF2892 domain-containing protein n=1 Tax=Haloarcula pelagica TaxID=3033389 RepID=UPI0024C20EEC|nr:DUF2892 domain-containing protein [Halomicroarcula sp. YJ-61-S]